MKKTIINEDWESVEVVDASSLFVLIFKQGSNTAGYIKCYNTDDSVVLAEYAKLIDQYTNVKFEEPTSIIVIKVPATSQVRAMLEEAVYAGDETNPTKIEIINHLLGRADCEYIEEKVLMSLEEAKKKKKKKKKTPKVTYTMGFPFLNDHRFNHAFGSCDCGKDAANDANSEMGSDSAGEGSGDGSLGGDSAGESGAMSESLTEAMTSLQKMQALENGTRGFNATAAGDIKLLDNLLLCAQNNLRKAAAIMIKEIGLRMKNGTWQLGPVPGLPMQPNTPQPQTPVAPSSTIALPVFTEKDFNPIDFELLETNQATPKALITAVERYHDSLRWAVVLLVLALSGGFTAMATTLKEWILTQITKVDLKQIIASIKSNTAIINKVTDICNKDIT
jgi:hypothetical protein